ncbi:Lysosomal beta glucosidase, partial [Phytophthora palmivora]
MEEIDDTKAFEAALSFVEEFSFDEATAEGLPIALLDNASSQIQDDALSMALNPGPETQTTGETRAIPREEKRRRQKEINERRRLLRKTGVYGDSNRVRNERTREIAFLREEQERLQLNVKVLLSQQAKEQRVKKNTALIATLTSVPSTWREQAVRHRRRREEAERDNVRLRLAIERQRKMANSLQGLMQKRARQLTNECTSLVNTRCSQQNAVDVLDFCGDIGDFRNLFCRLDSAYTEIDTVFAANGLSAMTITPDSVHVREGVEDKYLEFSTYKDLPFKLHDTAEVVWGHFKGVQKHMGNGSLYKKAAK